MPGEDTNAAARRVYHEAPDDVFELIVLRLSDVVEDEWGHWVGKGGFNALRLVSKRCLQVVESVATRLSCKRYTDSLPVAAMKRCRRIENIRCEILGSLEGCPDGLKSLIIRNGDSIKSLESLSACKELETIHIGEHAGELETHEIHLAFYVLNLSPLSSCTRLKKLILQGSGCIDITPLSLMPLLEEIDLSICSINDISPLSHCKRLKKLNIIDNLGIEDLSPLCQCPDLEELNISDLPLIEDLSFFEEGFTKLRVLNINYLPVEDLSPLTRLQNLEELNCWGIPESTSLLPLAKCYKLQKFSCSRNAMDLDELREKIPDVEREGLE
jgi:hypothetical protein